LVSNISKQVKERAVPLPKGMEQQVIIDIRGQTVTPAQIQKVINGVLQKSNGIIKETDITFIK